MVKFNIIKRGKLYAVRAKDELKQCWYWNFENKKWEDDEACIVECFISNFKEADSLHTLLSTEDEVII